MQNNSGGKYEFDDEHSNKWISKKKKKPAWTDSIVLII